MYVGRTEVSPLDSASIAARIAASGATWRGGVFTLARTESTQDDARRAAGEGAPPGTIFVADEQDRGRGRQGRTWSAAPGSALLASVVLRPQVAPLALPPLALVIGLAVAEAIEARVSGVGVKWPNDVLVRGRKVSGVLVEAQLRGMKAESVIAGFGVNVRRASLPADVAARATSLEEEGAVDLDRNALLADIVVRIEHHVRAYERTGLAASLGALRARDVAKGRRVEGESVKGIAAGIDDEGRLLVDSESGSRIAVSSGEVVFV